MLGLGVSPPIAIATEKRMRRRQNSDISKDSGRGL
jgi:hypothetical protein